MSQLLCRPGVCVPALCLALVGLCGVRAAEPSAGPPLPAGAVARLGTLQFRAGSPIVLVAYLPGGKQVLTVSQDASACVWDKQSGEVVRQFELLDPGDGEGAVARTARGFLSATGGQIACSRDGQVLALLNRVGGTVSFWEVATGKVRARTDKQARAPSRVALSADGRRAATATYDLQITVFDTATGKPAAQFSGAAAGEAARVTPYKLEFGPDGRTLALAGISFVQGVKAGVVVWDATTGQELRRWKDIPVDQSSLSVLMAAFSPDHKLLALPGRAAVSLVDLATGQPVRKLEGEGGTRLPAVAFSDDGKQLVGMGGRGEWVRVWDVATGKAIKQLGVGGGAGAGVGAAATIVRAQQGIVLSPDSSMLAWGDGPVLREMDLGTGRDRSSKGGHQGPVLAAVFSRDGRTVTTVGDGGPVQRWNAATGQMAGPAAFAGKPYAAALVSGDGRWAAALLGDGSWRVEEVGTGQELGTVKGEGPAAVYGAALSADGRQLATLNPVAGVVKVFDVATGREDKSINLPGARANAAAAGLILSSAAMMRRVQFSPGGQYLLLEGLQGLSVWHVGEGREHRPVALPEGAQVRQAAFTPDSRALAVELSTGAVVLVELATGRPRQTLTAPAGAAATGGVTVSALVLAGRGQISGPALAVSPDGRWLAQGRDDGRVRVWDLASGKVHQELSGHRGHAVTVAFDGSGRRLVSGSGDTTALVWDVPAWARGAAAGPALEAAARERAWADLAESDPARAFPAVQALGADPDSAAYLRERLKPAAGVDEAALARLIADLDSDMFAVRDRASRELEALGELAAPSLRKALKREVSAEVVRRVEDLLARSNSTSLGADQLRVLRAVEVLERLGTPEAEAVLRTVAGGAPGALGTVQAQEALERLGQAKKAGS